MKGKRILVVGLGGTGSVIINSLLSFSDFKIHLVDDDRIEISNLNRQFLYDFQDIGEPKAEVMKSECRLGVEIKETPYIRDLLSSLRDPTDLSKTPQNKETLMTCSLYIFETGS